MRSVLQATPRLKALRSGITVHNDGRMGQRSRLALPTLTILFGMAIARPLPAQTIVVVRPDASDAMLMEAFSRLCGELHMYGLQVRLSDREDGSSSDPGEPVDVLGGVTLLRSSGQASARMWTAEVASGKKSVGITVSIDDADAPSLLAIRAADSLRASLRDLRHPQPSDAKPPASAASGLSTMLPRPSAAVPSAAAPDGFERWAVRGAVGALWEHGELGVGWAGSLGLARRVASRLALELSIVAPITGQTYDGTATARLRQTLGMLVLAWRPYDRGRLTLELCQGLGAAYLTVRGEAQPPWLARADSAWSAASSSGGAVALRLSERMALSVSVAAVFLLPRPVLEVAGASYTAQQPWVLATGGLRYAF